MGEGWVGREDRDPVSAGHAPEVPAGYRRTEAGVIPDDWQIDSVSTIANVRTGPFGSALHERDYVDDGTPIVTVEHLGDYGITHQNLPLVSDTDRHRLKDYLLRPGDIVFSRVGSVDRNSLVGPDEDGWLFSGRLLRVRIRSTDSVSARYISYHLHTESFKKLVRSLAVGQTMASLNTQILKGVRVVLPPSREQRAIATVLSDVDELIESLEALIVKKRAIKQAAMQELLTGRTRLPGFGGKWEAWRLGDHLQFLRHGTNSRSDLTMDGSIQYLHYGDIHTSADVYLDPMVTPMPTIATEHAKKLDRLDEGDLIFVDASEDVEGVGKSVELHGLRGHHIVSGLHTIAVRFDKSVLADGFKAYLQFCPPFLRHLRRLAAGTKVYATNRAHIASARLPLPPLPEQRAIATVLSDMDAEIAALERRLDKTRAIKQGMMQQLLTGAIRLPVPQAEDDPGQ